MILFTNLVRDRTRPGDSSCFTVDGRGSLSPWAPSRRRSLPALAWAASEGGHGGGGLISLDKSLIIQGINFLILLFLLQRILYKPLLAKMSERTEAIRTSLDEAQRARAEAARQQEENAERLRAAHAEAAVHPRGGAQGGGGGAAEAGGGRARRGRPAGRVGARPDGGRHPAGPRGAAARGADLAIGVAEKLIRKSLDDADHRRIVAEAVGQLRN